MQPFLFWLIACLAGMPVRSLAQNAAADMALERKANEERFNILNARAASLSETQEVPMKRIAALEQRHRDLSRDLEKLKEESARASARHASRDELKLLVGKLQEIDKKREADKKLILESIRGLARPPAPAQPQGKPEKPKTKKN